MSWWDHTKHKLKFFDPYGYFVDWEATGVEAKDFADEEGMPGPAVFEGRGTLIENMNKPVFSDYGDDRFTGKASQQFYADYLWHQWLNCLSFLTKEHPTCKKARWYYEQTAPAHLVEYEDDLLEKGVYEEILSGRLFKFFPCYQPVKIKRWGAYEYHNPGAIPEWKEYMSERGIEFEDAELPPLTSSLAKLQVEDE